MTSIVWFAISLLHVGEAGNGRLDIPKLGHMGLLAEPRRVLEELDIAFPLQYLKVVLTLTSST
jgi:hypothetical protein